jgi:DNA-binding beta-propeller fold protein YncE
MSIRRRFYLAAAIAAACMLPAGVASAQGDNNSAPNPYRLVENWAKLPDGQKLGATISVDIDNDGKSVWVFSRCGAQRCTDSTIDPIHEFDESGKLLKSFGAGMFFFPHGLHVDRDGNLWVTDGRENNGHGQQAIKLSPDGKVLMTLGKAGIKGSGLDEFNSPSDAIVAPNGDIFVADGHGGDTNARIMKFSKDGKFIKTWGKKGSGPGEFNIPHRLAFDSAGRLYVADRNNNRIQIFDQDGNFIAEWKQFGRPSGIYIRDDIIYVADSESNSARNPGFNRGIRIGSVKDGKVTAFIPDPDPPKAELAGAPVPVETGSGPAGGSAAEGVAADAAGNVYGGEVDARKLMKYVKK